MKIADLDFKFPEELIATSPHRPSRVMLVDDSSQGPQEHSLKDLLQVFSAGDVLVLNDTKVLRRRVFVGDLEILFLNHFGNNEWEVLFPSKKYKIGEVIELPENIQMTLLQKGRPQRVKLSEAVEEEYFQRVAELPLPPYIQKARMERHNVGDDESWYQTSWAEKLGSFAAPTASLHFSQQDLENLKNKGVEIYKITLHVGLGTFLPVTTEDLNDHPMHSEYVEIKAAVWQKIQKALEEQRNIWALGTTVTRTLESAALKKIPQLENGDFKGETNLLIQPGFEFKIVNRLLTNFHQPQSTLLALVAAFSSLEKVQACYQWAIEKKFSLFSYGDLSAWLKPAILFSNKINSEELNSEEIKSADVKSVRN
jgi:S-adenosylmethionine:tRNA ribosyltransferase-isomerase